MQAARAHLGAAVVGQGGVLGRRAAAPAWWGRAIVTGGIGLVVLGGFWEILLAPMVGQMGEGVFAGITDGGGRIASLVGTTAVTAGVVQLIVATLLFKISREVFGHRRLAAWLSHVAIAYFAGAVLMHIAALGLPVRLAVCEAAGMVGAVLGLIGASLLFQQLRMSLSEDAWRRRGEIVLAAAAGIMVLENFLELGGMWSLLTDPGHSPSLVVAIAIIQAGAMLLVPLLLAWVVWRGQGRNNLWMLWVWSGAVLGAQAMWGIFMQQGMRTGESFWVIGSGAMWAAIVGVMALLEKRSVRATWFKIVVAALVLADGLQVAVMVSSHGGVLVRMAWSVEGAGLAWWALNYWSGSGERHVAGQAGVRCRLAEERVTFEHSL